MSEDRGREHELDAAIDAVARRMTSGDPGPGLRVRILARIEGGGLARAHRSPLVPVAAVTVLLVAGGLVAWRLSGPPGRAVADGDTSPPGPPSMVATGPRASEQPAHVAGAPHAVAATGVPDTPAVVATPRAESTAASPNRSRGAAPPRPAPRTGELAERMRREPGALELDPLPVAAPPALAGVSLDAVRLDHLTLFPLVVETLDEDERPEPQPSS